VNKLSNGLTYFNNAEDNEHRYREMHQN